MQKHDKNTLISLSLAGAIGYYLFNKLSVAGFGLDMDTTEYGVEEPEVEEVVAEPVEEVVEIEEAVVEEVEEVEEMFEEPAAEPEVDEPEDLDLDLEDIDLDLGVGETSIDVDVDMDVAAPTIEVEMTPNVEVTPSATVLPTLEAGVACASCGTVNEPGFAFCANCGESLNADPEFVQTELELGQMEAAPVEETIVEEPVLPETLNLDIDHLMDGLDELDDLADIDEMIDDTNVDVLLDVEQAQPIMDNIEALHNIDHKDSAAKQEYKSIHDFFDTI